MDALLISILTFTCVIGVGLIIMQPIMTKYVDSYEVRRRTKKTDQLSSAEAPKESAILVVCKQVGDIVLGALPTLGTKGVKDRLMHAGYRTPDHLSIFIGVKALTVAMCLLFTLATAQDAFGVLMGFGLAFCGWIIPNFILAGREKQRQSKVISELPTIIDLLIVCAQAGLGLLMCVDKVSKECADTCPVIASELKQLLNDVKIFAKPTAIALADMGERCGVEELTNLSSALVSAEQKGSDISYPLQMQAEALRDRIKRRREEEASKVPVKMVPVIMLFVMPLILCPMLGPAVVTIMQTLGPSLSGK
jgi:tight adherence protein C